MVNLLNPLHKTIRYLATGIALLFTVSGCGTSGNVEQPVASSLGVVDEYRLGSGDGVLISVWRNPDLSVNVPVRPDGKISVPLVGDVLVEGKTTEQLSKEIQDSLSDYIRNPQVTVIVQNPTSADYIHRIRVTGAVAAPQSIPYRKGITVLDVILEAGGVTPFAKSNAAKLYRQTKEGSKVYPIYLSNILEKGRLETNYTLLPQDIITVPERGF